MRRCLDLGAGTGKLTHVLADRYAQVFARRAARRAARDPRASACRGPSVRAGVAEAIPLGDARGRRAVFAGQAFHWFANDVAVAEIAPRAAAPAACSALLWNARDRADRRCPSGLPGAAGRSCTSDAPPRDSGRAILERHALRRGATRARSTTSTARAATTCSRSRRPTSWIASRDDRDEVLAELAALAAARGRVPRSTCARTSTWAARACSSASASGTSPRRTTASGRPYSQALLDRAQRWRWSSRPTRVARPGRGPGRLTEELARRFAARRSPSSRTTRMRALITDGDARAGSGGGDSARATRASTPSSWARRSTGSIAQRGDRRARARAPARAAASRSCPCTGGRPSRRCPTRALRVLSEPVGAAFAASAIRPGTTPSTRLAVRAAPLRAADDEMIVDAGLRCSTLYSTTSSLAALPRTRSAPSLFERVRPLLAANTASRFATSSSGRGAGPDERRAEGGAGTPSGSRARIASCSPTKGSRSRTCSSTTARSRRCSSRTCATGRSR